MKFEYQQTNRCSNPNNSISLIQFTELHPLDRNRLTNQIVQFILKIKKILSSHPVIQGLMD